MTSVSVLLLVMFKMMSWSNNNSPASLPGLRNRNTFQQLDIILLRQIPQMIYF